MDRLAEAEQALRKALEPSPQRITAHHVLALILAAQGRDAEALAEVPLEPAGWARLTALAFVHHLAGRKVEPDAALGEPEAKHAADSAFQIAAVHSLRGQADAAFAWIERGFARRSAGFAQACCEPTFRPLHGDPRRVAFLRKMGFPGGYAARGLRLERPLFCPRPGSIEPRFTLP